MSLCHFLFIGIEKTLIYDMFSLFFQDFYCSPIVSNNNRRTIDYICLYFQFMITDTFNIVRTPIKTNKNDFCTRYRIRN